MEIDFKLLILLAAIGFGLWWMSQNKPDTFATGKNFIIGSIESVWEKVTDKEPTPPPEDKQSEGTVEGDVVNYGKPYTQYECSSDTQCQVWFSNVEDIKCNINTGECYTAVS